MQRLRLVDVEIVDGEMIGIHFSDETAILVCATSLLALGLPRFAVLAEDSLEGAEDGRNTVPSHPQRTGTREREYLLP